MADLRDFAAAIGAALVEIGVAGRVTVERDGEALTVDLGQATGDDVDVAVLITPQAD